ncbi:MAG TPA: prolyl oligopeptidase family serine peptidase [Haliangiales bacterium]|nr:prolyl oligopeptidase family serine peptidase [Haliangiales bacterium]
MRYALVLAVPLAFAAATPPKTEKRPVVDAYHGVKVTDDYRWLENAGDPAVMDWAKAESAYARSVLDALPHVKEIRARVTEVAKFPQPRYGRLVEEGGRLFAEKMQPPKERPIVVMFPAGGDPEQAKVLVDPTVIDPEGNTSMDFFVPSRDGKRLAVSLSTKGTEAGDVHVYDVDGGGEIGPPVPRVNTGTAGGSLAWNGDGTGFFYTRHPLPGERAPADIDFYQQVYFHKVGDDPKNDAYQLGKDFPRIAENFLSTSRDGKYAADLVQNGDGGQFELYVNDVAAGKWTKAAAYDDKIKKAEFGRDGKLYLLSLKDAPRGKILRIDPAAPSLAKAEVVLPQGDGVVDEYLATETRLFVTSMVGGPNRLEVVPLRGEDRKPQLVPTPPVSSTDLGTALGGDDILYRNMSYVEPAAWYRYDGKSGKTTKTAMVTRSPIDASGFEVVRENAISKDGTAVPMNVIRKKGIKRNGQNPTLLYGYGGYGISQTPGFAPQFLMLVEQGWVVVEANLRGGGEFGEEWHLGGNLTKKQNVFDDFYACAKTLVDRKYTNPKKLAILGGSNGGLLMGAALTQHPEAYGAVVAHVGVHDMLRVETDPNGAFNTTEYGSTKDKAQFDALRAYSPYHNVKDGVRYPPALLTTGLNDPRVKSYHSFKMVARLQAADPKGQFLLRTNANTGHGAGKLSDLIELTVDEYAFLFHALGAPYKAVRSK